MGFTRKLDDREIKMMTGGENSDLFARLKADVALGEVFPAVRVNELHFYYRGGCLYRFANGKFERDGRYRRYADGTFSSEYERAKAETENRFTNRKGEETERRLLDKLCRATYTAAPMSDVVVLDIEVNLGGRGVRKCDLVLLNTRTDELMFVEGKVFSDRRVRCAVGHTPEVIAQVNGYSAMIAAQRQEIIDAYGEYVNIVNKLFGTAYAPPRRVTEPAKLLVYMTEGGREENLQHSVDAVESGLGKENVMWVKDERVTLSKIWEALI